MVRLFFYLAILIGVGYAAQRVPVGDRTAWQHVRDSARWESVRDAGSNAVAAVRSFIADSSDTSGPSESSRDSEKELQPGVAASAITEAHPDPRSDPGERPPAEKITAADRRALDELLPR